MGQGVAFTIPEEASAVARESTEPRPARAEIGPEIGDRAVDVDLLPPSFLEGSGDARHPQSINARNGTAVRE
jgi:hypothetical protein